MKKNRQQPESSQFRHLLCQVAEVSKIQSDNLDDDDCNKNSDEDKLVEIVEEMILDRAHHESDSEPTWEIDNIEVEENLEWKVGDQLIPEFNGSVLHGVG